MSTIQPGEYGDITIKDARISTAHESTGVLHAKTQAGGFLTFKPDDPQVTFERVAPAEWPPRPGDLWRDRDGDTWHSVLVDDDDTADEAYVILRPGRSSKHHGTAELHDIVQWHGPLTLVHREDEQDGSAS
ncbi:hypothetical protein OHR68_09775 [Spirillospora sp. NBC_00431]